MRTVAGWLDALFQSLDVEDYVTYGAWIGALYALEAAEKEPCTSCS
jgi:hypothetical protein